MLVRYKDSVLPCRNDKILCLPLKDGMQEGKAERLKGLPGRLTRGGTP